jgi:hypothetical protein
MYLNAIIFSKLQQLNDITINNDPSSFLTFAPVTMCFSNLEFSFLNPNTTAAEARQNAEYEMAFAQIANSVVRDLKFFQIIIDEPLLNAYERIINKAVLIDNSLSEDDRSAYTKARSFLFADDDLNPTPEYRKYKESAEKYEDLEHQIMEINLVLTENAELGDGVLTKKKQALELKKSVILNDWLITGNKDGVERALRVVSRVSERARYESEFFNEQQNLRTAIDKQNTINSNIEYLPTFCLPNNVYKFDFNGWKHVSISGAEIDGLETAAKKYLGDAIYDANNINSPTPITKIEFDYLFLTIQRSWFRKEIVESKFWKFDENDVSIVSDGSETSAGILPAYVEKFIFVRRISQFASVPQDNSSSEIHTPATSIYMFRDIAKLSTPSEIKEVKPAYTSISKLKFTQFQNAKETPVLMSTTKAKPALNMTAVDAKATVFFGHAPIKTKFVPKVSPELLKKLATPVNVSPVPEQPKSFMIEIAFKDPSGNSVIGLDVSLTNETTGVHLTAETNNIGKLSFSNMPAGSYRLEILENELFEDFRNTYAISAAFFGTVVLTKRSDPKFDMFLLGAVNHRFPKLPDPIPGASYN